MNILIAALAMWGFCHLLWLWLRPREAARPIYGSPRSGQWPALRRKWLALHPDCAVCGTTEEVEPHHVESFHLQPEKELDPHNLISLCQKHGCHLAFGHNYDWHAFNPHVRDDAKFQSGRVLKRKYE